MNPLSSIAQARQLSQLTRVGLHPKPIWSCKLATCKSKALFGGQRGLRPFSSLIFNEEFDKERDYMQGGKLPYEKNGVKSFPRQPAKQFVEEFYEKRDITNDIVLEYLTERFKEFNRALCAGDELTVREMTEGKFGEEMVKLLPNFKNLKYLDDERSLEKLERRIKEEHKDSATLKKNYLSDFPGSYIIDTIAVKGLSVKRDENHFNYDYVVTN